ncbi:MAG: hypothetical protein H6953_06845 [Chromatiaceae bacterium]|nr:hypothetical protein [Chromatiaceae bacterium]
MELANLITAPVAGLCLLLAAIAAWIGYALGRSNENQRKQAALADAATASQNALEALQHETQEKLEVLNKANAHEMEKAKQAGAQQVDRLNQAHQTLVESIRATHATEVERLTTEHSGLLDRLNAANNASIAALERRREQEIQQLKAEGTAALSALKEEHQAALQQFKAEHQAALQTLRDEHTRQIDELDRRRVSETADRDARIAAVEQQHQALNATLGERDRALADLKEVVKEAKLKNMFSVSKSGEKLIRVVRSVQELASELDETSRTVTDGEYSFFDQIKDQRDRETVLSLAGSSQTASAADAGDDVDGEVGDAPLADDAVEPQADADGFGAWMESGDEAGEGRKAPH